MNPFEYLQENSKKHLDELFDLLRIPSVSSQSERKGETYRCAEWVRDHCEAIGFKTEIVKTDGHPLVIGERCPYPDKPTLLIYGHYDVQPEDPVDLWDSPPFEPTVKGSKLLCRGAVDDKGQFFAHLKALEAILKTDGELPLNVKLIIEGEEEVGSEHLQIELPGLKDKLACDLLIVSDSPMFQKGLPTITLGLRGLVYFQIDIKSGSTDLHSGSFGGGVPNAATIACELVSKLKDENGKILIPGTYDDVRPLTDAEKESFDRLPFDAETYMKDAGVKTLVGEEGYSTLERVWTRPTCDVMGILTGYVGEGAKTVIPCEAMVKVSMRLVPDQKPAQIQKNFEAYVKSLAPEGIDVTVQHLHEGEAYVSDPEHPAFQAAMSALEEGFGAQPVFNREGGSIPIVNAMADQLNTPVLLLGLGLPDENAHAPNEYFDLDNFRDGMKAFVSLYGKLGDVKF